MTLGRDLLKTLIHPIPRSARDDARDIEPAGDYSVYPFWLSGFSCPLTLVPRRPSRLHLLFHRHVPFQVGIPLQTGHEIRDEAVRLLTGEVLRVAHLPAERRQKIGG